MQDTALRVAATVSVMLVALLHLYFLVLEMVLWTEPRTRKIFGTSKAQAQATLVMAQNQGLYNGFLALGLIYGLLERSPDVSHAFLVFFLGCCAAAGIFGGWTVHWRAFVVQAIPAFLALTLVSLRR